MRENAASTINLPEDDSKQYEHILRYAYENKYIRQCAACVGAGREEQRLPEATIESIKIYATAHKLGMVGLCQSVLEDVRPAITYHQVDFRVIDVAASYLSRGDKLLDVLLKQAVCDMKEAGWDEWKLDAPKGFEEFMAVSDNAIMLVEALVRHENNQHQYPETTGPDLDTMAWGSIDWGDRSTRYQGNSI